jgi:hypothetical protein
MNAKFYLLYALTVNIFLCDAQEARLFFLRENFVSLQVLREVLKSSIGIGEN